MAPLLLGHFRHHLLAPIASGECCRRFLSSLCLMSMHAYPQKNTSFCLFDDFLLKVISPLIFNHIANICASLCMKQLHISSILSFHHLSHPCRYSTALLSLISSKIKFVFLQLTSRASPLFLPSPWFNVAKIRDTL